ncbi:MAG: SDR family oxidoreductase [Ignavibacteriales bacterium]|nr:SDR family oxidoreductase [Ignavibacteriales bacterium]
MNLEGKIALVTGGTGALGSVIARKFVAERMKVAVSYILENELKHVPDEQKKQLFIFRANVNEEHEVVQLFNAVLAEFGRVDIVVNTVGGFLPTKPISEVSVEEWDRMMNLNLKSTFLCTREALRRMKGATYGRVVNTSAMVGLSPSPGRAAYAISKAAVSLLTEIVAQEVKGTGITVNAVAPSIIRTKANLESMPGEDSSKWVKPEEIAGLICYLCSESAGAITGTTMKAYGGV